MTTENGFNPYAIPDDVLHQSEDADQRSSTSTDLQVIAKLVYTLEHHIETLASYREHRGFGNIPRS
jgi:hypothetical protein